MLDSMALACYVAVAETRSFTRAAERVGRTQSAVSQQIAKLEDYLGVPLLVRGKQLALSAEGEIFLGYARQIVALETEALERFKEPGLEGEVRFGLPEDFATRFLSDVLVDFVRIHPRILLNVECDLTVKLFERFKNQEFDLVLLKMCRPEDFPYGVDVWSEKLRWVAHKPMAHVPGDKEGALPLVLSPQPCVYRSRAIQALEAAGIRWRLVFSSPSYAGTVAAVKAGLGLTVLPRTMIADELSALDAARCGLPELSDTHISLLKHDVTNPAIRSFEAFVLDKLLHG